MWEGCETLSTAPPILTCAYSAPKIYQRKRIRSVHSTNSISRVLFFFCSQTPWLWSLGWNPPWPFQVNRRDTGHVRWVIWNRFRYKLISSHQRNAKSLPIPSTKLHHVCEINPRDTRGCQTAQRTIILLSQTKQAVLPADFPLKGAAISPLATGNGWVRVSGWKEQEFIAALALWWAGKKCIITSMKVLFGSCARF